MVPDPCSRDSRGSTGRQLARGIAKMLAAVPIGQDDGDCHDRWEIMEMYHRVEFYETYRALREQVKTRKGKFGHGYTAKAHQGRINKAWLVDEFCRQLFPPTSTSDWVKDRGALSNDINFSGNVWRIANTFGMGILPLIPPKSRDR